MDMFTIGIYARKSVYRDNSDSVQVQVKLGKEYAGIIFKDKELEFRVYDSDEGFSGKNTNRPDFQRMMNDVENGLLNAVVVYKLDRISRNVQQFSAMYEILHQHQVAFISVKESFDTSTPMGRTVMYILAAFAQLERENTSERVTDGMLALGTAGKWTGGICPSGMKSVRMQCGDKYHSYLQINPDTIWRPKMLYELLLDGNSITKIERYCRDHGIKSQTGKYLNTSQIYNILTNPVYCQNSIEAYYYFCDLGCKLPDASGFDGNHGLIGYGKTKTGTNSQHKRTSSEWTIAIGIHDYVLPADKWIAAHKRLGTNKMIRTAKYEAGILKGVLKCSCGGSMEVRTYTKNNIQFSYYYCRRMQRYGKEYCNSGYTPVKKLDSVFLNKLKQIQLDPARVTLDHPEDVFTQSPADLKKTLHNLESSIMNLTNALTQAMGSSATEYIIKQIEELDHQKQITEAALRDAKIKEAQRIQNTNAVDQIYQSICYLLDHFDDIDYHGKNELIRKIVKSCIFDGENLKITF